MYANCIVPNLVTPTTSRIKPHQANSPPSPTALRPPPSPLALRATSEPPQNFPSSSHTHANASAKGTSVHQISTHAGSDPVQEYSWEWGAFPQPSPMQTKFPSRFESSAARVKGKGRMHSSALGSGVSGLGLDGDETYESYGYGKGGSYAKDGDISESIDEEDGSEEAGVPSRSRSVPPELDSPTLQRRELDSPSLQRRELPAEDAHHLYTHMGRPKEEKESGDEFGSGGRLTSSRRDPTRFGVFIEGKSLAFELALAPSSTPLAVFTGHDELAAADAFSQGQITYARFMAPEGERIVKDERLVIRWAGGQYITRAAASPLMGALVLWREAALRAEGGGDAGFPSPMASPKLEPQREEEPLSEGEEERGVTEPGLKRAESEPIETTVARKPSSSGWSRWWSRSQTSREAEVQAQAQPSGRPGLRGSTSEVVSVSF